MSETTTPPASDVLRKARPKLRRNGGSRLFWLSRPIVWFWRCGYWDWDATRMAIRLALAAQSESEIPKHESPQ